MYSASFSPQFDWNTQIGNQLLHLKLSLKSLHDGLEVIDFSKMSFTPPLLAIHYASMINESSYIPKISGLNFYLETISFPYCISPRSKSECELLLNSYLDKSYVPIIKFDLSSLADGPRIREMLLSHVFATIRTITNLPTNYFTAISYMVSELIDNMVEHSGQKHGYLAFQYYSENGFMDICLADRGAGLLGSYQNYVGERDFSAITNHLEAVDSAVKGRSTKPIPEDRGYGIATSRRILTQGLGGTFVYLTGNALLINEELSNFGFESRGIIVVVRIPIRHFNKEFNWTDFVE